MMGNEASEAQSRKPRFIYLLTLAQRRVQAAIEADGDGKTAARAGLLMALNAGDKATAMKQVGIALGLGAPALSGLVDRMMRDGLVERHSDPADARAWNITLTDAGRALRGQAVRSARSLNDRLCEGFDDVELAIVARWLEAAATKFPKER
jgi:DNA-binding MarR family transcriptional regulator